MKTLVTIGLMGVAAVLLTAVVTTSFGTAAYAFENNGHNGGNGHNGNVHNGGCATNCNQGNTNGGVSVNSGNNGGNGFNVS